MGQVTESTQSTKDPISRAELFDELNRRGVPYNAEVNMVINGMPSAQPEIIYCKDCVHHIDGFFCRQANHHTSDKDHCASVFRAERREE